MKWSILSRNHCYLRNMASHLHILQARWYFPHEQPLRNHLELSKPALCWLYCEDLCIQSSGLKLQTQPLHFSKQSHNPLVQECESLFSCEFLPGRNSRILSFFHQHWKWLKFSQAGRRHLYRNFLRQRSQLDSNSHSAIHMSKFGVAVQNGWLLVSTRMSWLYFHFLISSACRCGQAY